MHPLSHQFCKTFLEKNVPESKKLGDLYILSVGGSVTKGMRFYSQESKIPDQFCLTLSCNGLCANTSKCHLVQDLSRCPRSCSLRALWRCEGDTLGQYFRKRLCHPIALPWCVVSMRTVFIEENWAQTSSSLNVDTGHLGDCWKLQFSGIWRPEVSLGNWVSVGLQVLRGEGASEHTGGQTCSC